MKQWLIAFLLPCAAVAAPRYSRMSPDEQQKIVRQARTLPLVERIATVSAPFIGTPYGTSPLGEGAPPDNDPLIRYDRVDCLTFVETTLAMSLAPEPSDLLQVLNDIRYSEGPPAFERRNHFAEAEWIPQNIAKGYIRPISREIAGDRTVTATTDFSLQRWHASPNAKELPLPDSALPRGKFSVEVVPLEFAGAHLDQIPDGTIMFVVRKDFWHDPTRVSHVGFVLTKNGRKVLRHASKEPYDRVVDEPLKKFFRRNERYDKRPVVGVALFEVQAPTERIARLASVTTH